MSSICFTPEQFHQYQQQWTQQVADGDTEAQRHKTNAAYWLAHCYLTETGGVHSNRHEGVQILEQAIQEQDGIDSDNHNDNTGKHRCLLAFLVREHDETRSSQLYCQAVPRLETEVQLGGNDANYQQAACCLGYCLFFGRGVDEDEPRGIHWLRNAAELGHREAQTIIESFCIREPFVAEIVRWLHQLVDQNNSAWAQFRLGECFRYGRGVKKDFVKAVEWYNKAIAQGHDTATRCRQNLLNRLSPEERSKTLGCVERNQKIENATSLIQQSFVGEVPLSLWPHALAFFQCQEHPPWEAPSPTFQALCEGIMPQLQKLLSDKNQNKKKIQTKKKQKHCGRVG